MQRFKIDKLAPDVILSRWQSLHLAERPGKSPEVSGRSETACNARSWLIGLKKYGAPLDTPAPCGVIVPEGRNR